VSTAASSIVLILGIGSPVLALFGARGYERVSLERCPRCALEATVSAWDECCQ
jgi:hypothetical protein